MRGHGHVREQLTAAVSGTGTPLSLANRLCHACVELLDVDGAAISVVHKGVTQGTFGSSNALSRRIDAYQFTYGEGPCLDAAHLRRPVLVEDLDDVGTRRWPAFSPPVLEAGVQAVFAMPVLVASESIGALDLFRHRRGPLSEGALSGGILAAGLAALPLLDLIARMGAGDPSDPGDPGGPDRPGDHRGHPGDPSGAGLGDDGVLGLGRESLERVEIYQATGFLLAQSGGGSPGDALVRLRARAFSTGQTAREVALEILDYKLRLDADGNWHSGEEHR